MAREEQQIRDIQHFGEEGGVVPVIDVAATATFLNPQDMERTFRSELEGCYLYSRHSNPSVVAFGQKLAAMEGAEAGLGVASGMAAIASAIHQLLPQGGHILSSRTVYGGTYALFANIFPKQGIQTNFVDTLDLSQVEKNIRPETKVIYTETMSNPLLALSDIEGLAKLAKKHGLKLVVDNTFTPLIISPIKLGADVVVYSCTKFISGASDLIAGAIVGARTFINQLVDLNHGMVMLTGPVMDSRIAHELYLRLDHLPIRMRAHSEAAAHLVSCIQKEGIQCIYPGLVEHPQYSLLLKQMNRDFGFGGMVTLDCGSVEKAQTLAAELQHQKFGLYAVSLGFSRTLMSVPASSTSSEIPSETQAEMGLTPGLLRLSIGFVGDHETMADRFISSYKSVVAES